MRNSIKINFSDCALKDSGYYNNKDFKDLVKDH